MATYPLSTLGPTISSAGISIPSYNDVYQSLLATYQGIYGSDVYLSADSQDGQWIAALAKAIDDSNQAAVKVFNALSPTYANGAQLSSLVKINGIARSASSHSTAVGTVTGVAGTNIVGGVVKDAGGNLWNLPASVAIPGGGSIAVTVTAQQAGAISAAAGTINTIYNPQLGWQTFASTSDATPGAPVETDDTLRARQANSTAGAAQTLKEAIYVAVGNVAGVTDHTVYTNDSTVTDANGVPAHCVSVIAAGGNIADVAAAIASKKAPGTPTYGTTTYTVTDSHGMPCTINYYVLANVAVYFAVTIKALTGYTAATADQISAALAAYVTALSIGDDVYKSQAQAAASLMSSGLGKTFNITDFRLGTAPAPVGTADIVIAFNQRATCTAANVGITVT